MNEKRLKAAEKSFLKRYPGGFKHPELQAIVKKHHKPKLLASVQEAFAASRFKDTQAVLDSFVKIISQSTVVSVFEKTKLRNVAPSLSDTDRKKIVLALKEMLHGDRLKGFDQLSSQLKPFGVAKWPVLTALLLYYDAQKEVIIKPTTAKAVIDFFEVRDLKYTSTPTSSFYKDYRSLILKMRKMVSPEIAPDNGAFSGFLMMSMEEPVE